MNNYKIILTFPQVERFKWETEVLLTNLKSLGFSLSDVILLIAADGNNFTKYFEDKYGVEAHHFSDKRQNKEYIPSITAFLWWKFLERFPEKQRGKYLYIDSDVIFRKLPQFDNDSDNVWLGADCNGYLNASYIKSCTNGENIFQHMCNIVGVKREDIESIDKQSIGAQWLIINPSIEYWKKTYQDCNNIWNYFSEIKDSSNLQWWTASMWSQLYNAVLFGLIPKISDELSFAWSTDPVSVWNEHNVLHNAGVTADMKDLFFKGAYIYKDPFGQDFSYVNPEKCSIKYVEAINKVK